MKIHKLSIKQRRLFLPKLIFQINKCQTKILIKRRKANYIFCLQNTIILNINVTHVYNAYVDKRYVYERHISNRKYNYTLHI